MTCELIASFLSTAALVRAAQSSATATHACRRQTGKALAMLARAGPAGDAAIEHLELRCRVCGGCVMATSEASEPERP
jgi:hypothetical protein